MRPVLAAAILLTILLAALLSIGGLYGLAYSKSIFPGVTVHGIDLGGLTPAQASDKLAELPPVVEIALDSDQGSHRVTVSRLTTESVASEASRQAFAAGRRGPLWERYRVRLDALTSGYPIVSRGSVDRAALTADVQAIKKLEDRPPVDARLLVAGDKVRIEAQQTGYTVDVEQSVQAVLEALATGERRVQLAAATHQPSLASSDVQELGVDSKVGEFSTDFIQGQENRNSNISLAAARLDGLLLMDGEEFSFNQSVGRRTAEAGYREAPIIVGRDLDIGVGGGICQVATTLYNAVMDAGLPVTDRNVHSNFIAAYPIGRDAGVSWGTMDLRFKNDTGSAILIKSFVRDDKLTFRIYGADLGRVNEYTPPIVDSYVPHGVREEIDPQLPAGVTIRAQSGVDGRKVKLTRRVSVKDTPVIEEEIVSSYVPRDEVLRKGPVEGT